MRDHLPFSGTYMHLLVLCVPRPDLHPLQGKPALPGLLVAAVSSSLTWALGQMITIAFALWLGAQARPVMAEPWAAAVRWFYALGA